MHSGARFVLALVLASALAAGASRLPAYLSGVDFFRVRDVRLEGASFLTLDEALRWAALPEGANVWDEPGRWVDGLRGHPLVREAEVERELPGTLILRVRERKPVALVPTPTLEPVDVEGRPLPLDPARHRLDLPVIRPTRIPDGRRLTPQELRSVAGEVGRLEEMDPRFLASLSELAVEGRGDLVAHLLEPRVEIRFRPPLTPRRLREGLRALSDAAGHRAEATPRTVDLRYEDQVVVRLSNSNARQSD